MQQFTWDPNKNETNKAKHGISFEDVSDLIRYRNNAVMFKTVAVNGEARDLLIVQDREMKCWTVAVTMRGEIMRIISCRRSRQDEREHYDKARE